MIDPALDAHKRDIRKLSDSELEIAQNLKKLATEYLLQNKKGK